MSFSHPHGASNPSRVQPIIRIAVISIVYLRLCMAPVTVEELHGMHVLTGNLHPPTLCNILFCVHPLSLEASKKHIGFTMSPWAGEWDIATQCMTGVAESTTTNVHCDPVIGGLLLCLFSFVPQ